MFAGRLGTADVTADAYERSIVFARAIAAQAAQHDLTLTAETHPDTLCDSVAACRRFLRDVAAPNLHLCFQPFDFADTARAVVDYEALREHVVHVHVQGHANDEICLLKDADIDYRRLFAALPAGGFDGYCCIEFVEGSIVEDPADFDLEHVLANAQRDRAFIETIATEAGLALSTED